MMERVCCQKVMSSTPSPSFFRTGFTSSPPLSPSAPPDSSRSAREERDLPAGPLDREKAMEAAVTVPRSVITQPFEAPKRRPDTRDRGCVGRSGTSSELAMTPASTSQPFGFDAAVDSTNTTALSMSSPVARVSCSCPTLWPCRRRRRRRSNVFRLAALRKGGEASDGLLPVHVGLSAVRVAHLDPALIAMLSIRSLRCRPF
mmetsp:Transcript_9860/g.29986  ORF Transcript_9860/g.29986 Transcript_9860/m.29986 type:complete len:202 (+) Transcript_9860:414-1019(+)